MRKLLSMICLLFVCYNVRSQILTSDPGLRIGDNIPEGEISNIINDIYKRAKISDYKDQLLLLDFWSTSCSSCIAAMPEMERLQKKFGSKLKILPVTAENESLIRKFWSSNNYTKNLSLPTVVNDTLLNSFFKHTGDPHEAWIYKGKVVAITDGQYVTEENIKKVLSGLIPDWIVKNEFYIYDRSKSLFGIRTSTQVKYVSIGPFQDSIATGYARKFGIVPDSINNIARHYFINQSIFDIYFMCLREIINPRSLVKPSLITDSNEVVWQVKDKSLYRYDGITGSRQEWLRKNGICFESKRIGLPQNRIKENEQTVRELNAILGLNVHWEKRREKVYILDTTHIDNKKYVTANGKLFWLSNIVYQLNQINGNPYIFFDDSKFVDRKIIFNVGSGRDFKLLNEQFKIHGYLLKEEIKDVDKLIFNEVGFK